MVRECAEEGTGIVLVVEMALRPNNTAEEREMFVKATLNMQLPSVPSPVSCALPNSMSCRATRCNKGRS